MLEFFANNEIDSPVFAQDILTISYEIDPPIAESRPIENDVQFLDVTEVVEDDEVFYHAFMEREDNESNEPEDDDVGCSESVDIKDANECDEDDIDGTLLMSIDEEAHIERTYPTRYNVDDQIPYFSL